MALQSVIMWRVWSILRLVPQLKVQLFMKRKSKNGIGLGNCGLLKKEIRAGLICMLKLLDSRLRGNDKLSERDFRWSSPSITVGGRL